MLFRSDGLVSNDIGEIVLALDWPLTVEPYEINRDLGSFILIDREHFETVGIGFVVEPDAPPAADRSRRKSRRRLHSVLWNLAFGRSSMPEAERAAGRSALAEERLRKTHASRTDVLPKRGRRVSGS